MIDEACLPQLPVQVSITPSSDYNHTDLSLVASEQFGDIQAQLRSLRNNVDHLEASNITLPSLRHGFTPAKMSIQLLLYQQNRELPALKS